MRVDGQPTERFWNGKALFTYLGAAESAGGIASPPTSA